MQEIQSTAATHSHTASTNEAAASSRPSHPQEETTPSSHTTKKSTQHDQLTLSPEAEAIVTELQTRDREVRAHEQAHMAAGAGLTGGASYTYQTGPDGQRYAVGGEVSIDTGAIAGDPSATIEKAEQVRKAALAPANPSAQDLSVAASATQTITAAEVELSKMEQEASNQKEEEISSSEASTSTNTAASEVDETSEQTPPAHSQGADERFRLYATTSESPPLPGDRLDTTA